jgi:cyanophycinase
MPAPVPPGYTRGPILFLGPFTTKTGETELLQRFWSEAGGYGARLVLITSEANSQYIEHVRALFTQWEADTLTTLPIHTRPALFDPALLPAIDAATGILFIDGEPTRLARLIGGTPAAQAIRRANARAKTVGSLASAAGLLCQHVLLRDSRGEPHFAPGLGLINRIALAPPSSAPTHAQNLALLRHAIAPNPFLVGVCLGEDTGIVLYPDTTLEVCGASSVLLLDAAATTCADLGQLTSAAQLEQYGVHLHELQAGYTFNFDTRAIAPPPLTDIPATGQPVANKSSF